MDEARGPKVIPLCACCAFPLHGPGQAVVIVRNIAFHAACWLLRLAPSIGAGLARN